MIFIPGLEQLNVDEEMWSHVTEMAQQRQIDDEVLLDVQQRAAQNGRWDVVYAISVLAGLETSVLIDAENVISIDWGTCRGGAQTCRRASFSAALRAAPASRLWRG